MKNQTKPMKKLDMEKPMMSKKEMDAAMQKMEKEMADKQHKKTK